MQNQSNPKNQGAWGPNVATALDRELQIDGFRLVDVQFDLSSTKPVYTLREPPSAASFQERQIPSPMEVNHQNLVQTIKLHMKIIFQPKKLPDKPHTPEMSLAHHLHLIAKSGHLLNQTMPILLPDCNAYFHIHSFRMDVKAKDRGLHTIDLVLIGEQQITMMNPVVDPIKVDEARYNQEVLGEFVDPVHSFWPIDSATGKVGEGRALTHEDIEALHKTIKETTESDPPMQFITLAEMDRRKKKEEEEKKGYAGIKRTTSPIRLADTAPCERCSHIHHSTSTKAGVYPHCDHPDAHGNGRPTMLETYIQAKRVPKWCPVNVKIKITQEKNRNKAPAPTQAEVAAHLIKLVESGKINALEVVKFDMTGELSVKTQAILEEMPTFKPRTFSSLIPESLKNIKSERITSDPHTPQERINQIQRMHSEGMISDQDAQDLIARAMPVENINIEIKVPKKPLRRDDAFWKIDGKKN